MRRDKIDKTFIDSSWQEMQGILDREMPSRKNRKGIIFWFLGLFLLLSGIATGFYMSNYQSKSLKNTINSITAVNRSATKVPQAANHEVKKEVKNNKIEFVNEVKDPSEKDIKKVLPSSVVTDVITFQNSEINNNAKIDIEKPETIANPDNENIEEKEYYKFAKPPKSLDNRNETTPERKFIVVNYLTRLRPNTLFASSEIDLPARIELAYPPNPIIDRFELNISTRIYDQFKPNGEVVIQYNVMNENFGIIPGIGLGYDNYSLFENGETINDRTLINANVNTIINNSFELEPPGVNSSQSFPLTERSALYFSQHLLLRKKIISGFYLQTGILSRIYSKVNTNINGDDGLVTEDETQTQGGSGQARGEVLDLQQDNNDLFLMAGLSGALSNNLMINVSYIHQLDKSLSLKAYEGTNNYTNVLERINRNEIRLGLAIKF